jgi:hypothetical protein
MSQRSIYLRDQAATCQGRAENIGDGETLEGLQILTAELAMRAVAIENKQPGYGAGL